jgi:hypothetical protein
MVVDPLAPGVKVVCATLIGDVLERPDADTVV